VVRKVSEQHFRLLSKVALGAAATLLYLGASRFLAGSEPEVQLDEWTITHFQQAREAEKNAQFQKAAEEYRLVVSRNPNFAEAWLNLGIVYQRQSDYAEAIKVFRRALALKPIMVPAQVLLGMSLCLTQDYRAALKPLDDALAQDPKERQAGIYRALALSGLEQPEAAAQQLRRTLAYYPDDPEILYHLGEAYTDGIRQSGELIYKKSRDSAVRVGHGSICRSQRWRSRGNPALSVRSTHRSIHPSNLCSPCGAAPGRRDGGSIERR
jgi:tetratricopeptide (TPR) repeat protein